VHLYRFARDPRGDGMKKEDIYDILAAVAVGLMLAFFLTIRG
jgi:hypothetical protein